MRSFEEFEQDVRRAMREAVKAGWGFCVLRTIDYKTKHCCPIGSLVVADPWQKDPAPNEILRRLGYSSQALAAMEGWDGISYRGETHWCRGDKQYYDLGVQLRKEYLEHGRLAEPTEG